MVPDPKEAKEEQIENKLRTNPAASFLLLEKAPIVRFPCCLKRPRLATIWSEVEL